MTIRYLTRHRFSLRGGTPKHVYDGAGGGYFYTGRREEFDHSSTRILTNIVDTVRQLYKGTPLASLVRSLRSDYESCYQAQVEYFGYSWILRSSAGGGFRYMLQNNDLGLIIHLINKHVKSISDSEDDFPESTHLKIECSPHLLLSHSPGEIQDMLDEIASDVFDASARHADAASDGCAHWDYAGCALHLAADIAGIGDQIPDQFSERFITYANLRPQYTPMTGIDYSTNIIEFGERQSITYGGAATTQFQMYNKTAAAIAQDKIAFWQKVWLQKTDQFGNPIYRPGEPVMRVEFRMHHSVIQQFTPSSAQDYDADSLPLFDSNTGEIIRMSMLGRIQCGQSIYPHANVDLSTPNHFTQIQSYFQASQYLDSLWQYVTTRFRLQLKPKSSYVDPLWSILKQDIDWCTQPIVFKRTYTKKTEGSEKNIGLFLGNALSLVARKTQSLGVNRAVSTTLRFLRKSTLWKDVFMYYFKKVFFDQYLRYQKEIQRLGYSVDPVDWARHIPKDTFNTVLQYVRDDVIGLGITKRLMIGRAAV